MNNKLKALFPIGCLCILLFFTLIFVGSASLEFCGFGVDKNGLLYIGRLHQIEVYKDGINVHTMPTPVGRGWIMATDSEYNIIVSDMSTIFTLDTTGEIITTQKDIHSKQFYEIRKVRKVNDLDGNEYVLKHKWIRPTILKNGSVIYKVPFVDTCVRILFACGMASLMIGVIACKLDNRDKMWFNIGEE